ncbi:MAG: S1C family serine protease [Candidatus Anammoxibacter sp.]
MTDRNRKLIPVIIVVLLACYFLDGSGRSFFRKKGEQRPVTLAPGKLGQDERATIEVFKLASPSVVYITNKQFKRDLFSFNIFKIPQGSGSGFIWDDSGHIVTNFHVIYKANEVDVTLTDGSVWNAKLVGADPDHDIAVLKIDAYGSDVHPIILGNSSNLEVGQKVLAIGNPFGLDSTLTTGIISALGRTIEAMTGRTIFDVIQTDAAINPGNSGGPLLDSFGRLIGMNTSIMSTSGSSAGIGFAVPVNTVNRTVCELINHGRVDRPGLGVSLIPDNITRRLNIDGVGLLEVFPEGAAYTAGLKGTKRDRSGKIIMGDVIVEIEGAHISNSDDLIRELSRYKVGDEILVKVLREDKMIIETKVALTPVEKR